MTIKVTLELEKKDGKFYAGIVCVSKGKKRTFMSLFEEDAIEAVCTAIQPFMMVTPNLTQAEIDKHYEKYP